jgi:hypothetical protein
MRFGCFKGERILTIVPKKIALFLSPLLLLSFFIGPGTVFAVIGLGEGVKSVGAFSHGEEISLILKVLENKLDQQKLPPKTLEKLLSLSAEQIGLIASLAERIADNSQAVGAEAAFLLITALLVLS